MSDGSAPNGLGGGARASNPARPMRPRELEDTLNHRFYHPLAWQLAKLLARTPLTPNQVSVIGGLTVVSAGIAYISPCGAASPARR